MDKLRRQQGREIVRGRDAPALAAYLKTANAKEVIATWKCFISSIAVADTVDLSARDLDGLPVPGMSDGEKMLLLFIQAGADIHFNYNYTTPIMKCAGFGWMTALDELVARGASPGTTQVSAGFAKKRRNGEVLTCGSPMHRAAQSGHIAVMERLLSLGAAVDDGDQADQTPLFRAAVAWRLDVMEWLAAHGADLTRRAHGQNLLHALMTRAHLECSDSEVQRFTQCARWLIEQGVDPAAVDGRGHSAISMAAERGRTQIGAALKATIEGRTLDQEIGPAEPRDRARL